MDSRYTLKFKRRRKGKTDYKFRYHILLSKKPRLIVRKTNTRIIVQIIDYLPEGDKVIVNFSSDMLNKNLNLNIKTKNRMAAYLTGYIVGLIAKNKKIKNLVLDIGMHKHHPKGRIYAVLKGVLEHGINIPHDDKILPDDNMINVVNGKDMSKEIKKYKELIESNVDKIFKKTNKGKKIIKK